MSLRVHHLNAGTLHAPPNPPASCHVVLLEDAGRLVLIDTGIGLLDVADPAGRIGQALIDRAGFRFCVAETAARLVESLGFRPDDVTDILLTHGDPDHAGGLADFPAARVHVAAEELASIVAGRWRYLPQHFAHGPRWVAHPPSPRSWFGLEARPIDLGIDAEIFLVPTFGHTLGHCGVAVGRDGAPILHAGDAYYLRVELERDDHPVTALASSRADDDAMRVASLARLRDLRSRHPEVEMFGYHDFAEFPPSASARNVQE